jgi:hypothetical protein
MCVVLTIKESGHGLWCICSGSAVRLYDRLRFAQAIRLAHEMARSEHASSGCATRVEMACPEFTIVLMQYAGPAASSRAAA